MYDIKLGNMKSGSPESGYKDIRIDRASKLGNPFDLDRNESLRDSICDAYHRYLWESIKAANSNALQPIVLEGYGLKLADSRQAVLPADVFHSLQTINEVNRSSNVRLMCWCVRPNQDIRCHGQSIIAAVRWLW